MSNEHLTDLLTYTAIDLLTSDSSPAPPARVTETSSSGPSAFDIALSNLFHASFEAGQPPEALRALLACEHWQLIAAPDTAAVVAGLELTGAFAAQAFRPASNKKKKHLQPTVMPASHNVAAFLVSDGIGKEVKPANTALAQLAAMKDAVQFVVLRYLDQDYTFTRKQIRRLREEMQEREERRQRAAQEARDLAILAGAGSLDDFLALRVKVDPKLPALLGKWGQLIAVESLNFSGRIHQGKILTIKELALLLQGQDYFDGLEINAPYSGDPVIHFGPNFATDCLTGVDPRSDLSSQNQEMKQRCLAAPMVIFPHAEYRTRFFTRLDDQDRQWIAERLQEAKALRAAIAPEQAAFKRTAVRTIKGAYALRTQAKYAERTVLDRLIARLERALKTRWRVGIY